MFAVTPGEPVIRINGHEIDNHNKNSSGIEKITKQIGPFSEGSTIALECTTSGGRPIPEVKWWNGSKPLRSKISLSESNHGPVVISTLRFIVSRYDLGAKFECRVFNNATDYPLSSHVSLDVHGKTRSANLISLHFDISTCSVSHAIDQSAH